MTVRVGWLADNPGYVGGAELTQREFRAAAPDHVTIVDCPPGRVEAGCDRYAIHNCVTYSPEDLEHVAGGAVKYWNDVGSWYPPELRAALDARARPVCCSPLQAQHMQLEDAMLIPPPVDLRPFMDAAGRNGHRAGAVSIGAWRSVGKGARNVARWALETGNPVNFFGDGAYAPDGSARVPRENLPLVLARYRTFVFLPSVIEPFGRLIAEAWAAGCEIVTNHLVGACHWIQHDPDAIDTAADDFWRTVLDDG